MNLDINNLGTFSNIKAVWAKYPEGGKEGDYLMIGNTKYRWNKYDQIWENAATVTQGTARSNEIIDGDLTVQNNLTVAGTLRAKAVKQPNCGLFKNLDALKAQYPKPDVGMWAAVGNSTPADIYRCDTDGVWTATGEKGGVDNLDLTDVETNIKDLQTKLASESTTRAEKDTALNALITSLKSTVDTLMSGDASEAIESFNEVIAFLKDVKDDETLTGILNNLNTAIESLQATATELTRTIVVDEINSFPSTEQVREMIASGSVVTRYTVMDAKKKLAVGYVDFFFDQMKHQLIEVLTTINSLSSDGNIETGTHRDGTLLHYVRFYNINSPHLTNERATWTKWKEDVPDSLLEKINQVATLANNAKKVVMLNFIIRKSGIMVTIPNGKDQYYYNAATNKLYKSEFYVLNSISGYRWAQADISDTIIYVNKEENVPYRYDGSTLVAIAPKDSPASIFNATVEKPVSGYYTLCDLDNTSLSAVHAAWEAQKAVSGLMLSYEMGAGIWKTYQYVGKTVTESNWFDTDNWKDFGSLAAGSETYIIIDALIGNPAVGDYYTLNTAVQALMQYQKDSGVTYAKKGLIISYKTGENTMETKQFQGEINDFGEVSLWKDFGGGSKVETKDAPEKNGKDALSTGGAYAHIPTSINVNTETEGTVKLHLENDEGEMVGEEVQFLVGTGSGGTGTTIAVQFQQNPLYGKAGGEFVVKAAIMSVTKAGSQEMSNSIFSVEVIDRTTKKTLATFQPKQPSSATLDDYSFSFDISNLFTLAGQSNLQLLITDDGGNTATKNLSVVAVDVTCVSAQTLNYTKDTSLEVGGRSKNILMYSFPNNASDKGIKATIEIYKDNTWKTLAQPVVTDTYSHTVAIDPTGMAHGAYPIRIQGEDVASGVKGNTLHTAVMVIQQDSTLDDYDTPIVVARWSDDSESKKKLFSTVEFDVAVYKRSVARPEVSVIMELGSTSEEVAHQVMGRDTTYTIDKRLVGYNEGDMLTFRASCGDVSMPEDYVITIDGTLLPISETEGAVYKIDLAGRSNADSDKSIKVETSDGGEVRIDVTGSNYSTNGFVKSSFGTSEYGTPSDKGRMALRVAEDVTAVCTDEPFSNANIETNGMALSFTVMVKNVADRNAHIMECMGDKLGFVLTGEKLVVAVNGDLEDAATSATVPYVNDKETRFDIVIEPSAIAPYGGIGVIKIFRNGDEAGAVAYKAGELPTTNATIKMDGHEADLYLFTMTRWNTYYNFVQACNNYLIGLLDTNAMISEYEKNDVLVSQTAEGTTKDRPSMQKCLDAGLMVCVITKNPDTDDIAANYPDYLEGLDGDKKTKQVVDWYCYFPDRPWQNCHIIKFEQTNQGTTSSWRPIKNKKGKFKKAYKIELLYTREEIAAMYNNDETILAKYDACAENAAKNKIQIIDGGNFTNIATIKVDYSDSCGAHNGAMMHLMNDTQIALGDKYKTPAQVFNEGSYEIHTSIDSVPCALFRTDSKMNSNDACDPTKAYFHAKANFNADKGDAGFYGFEKTKGYNADCLNYGDFKELVAAKDQDLTEFKNAVLNTAADKLVAGNIYVLSEYCGPKHVVLENDGTGAMVEVDAVAEPTEIDKTLAEVLADAVNNYKMNLVYHTNDDKYCQYHGGNWKDTSGEMTFNPATKKWSVSGRVVNPVECYEFLKYDAFDWGQGANSPEDLMKIDPATNAPLWLSYYESRYPDDDDLNALYEAGKKVPYQLYRWLHFNQECNHNLTEDSGANGAKNADGSEKYFNGAGAATTITLGGKEVAGTKENRLKKWRQEVRNYANPYSLNCYVIASDYKAAVDQRSKNMMIAFYLDTDLVMRAYFNHWYDGDCVDGSDNDCGLTIPWDMDAKTSHLYQGWDGVMFNQAYRAEETKQTDSEGNILDRGGVWLDKDGTSTLTLHDVADAMRKVEKNGMRLFSADGCYYYWVTLRLNKWAKVISSFDGERKYIQNSTSSANYFYALHGLRLEDLPDYQRKRFKMCDGQYEVGDLYTNPFKMRAMGTIQIKITAAQDGFFGLGEDRADTVADKCQLKAGESYTLTANAAQESGKMIYIFGADKLAVLDISACTPKQEGFDISSCVLLEKLIVGGFGYTPAYTTGLLSSLELPAMPFLQEIDIQYTKILSLRAANCPRLKTVKAYGSSLRTFTPSEACPLDTLQLPSTMTDIALVNMPKIAYPNGGMNIEGFKNVVNIRVGGCPNVDALQLLEDALDSGAKIATVTIPDVDVTKGTKILDTLKSLGTRGNGSELTNACDGLSGKWMFDVFVEDEKIEALRAYFPELEIKNVQYTLISFDDTVEDGENISNEDNKTGYAYGNDYVPSGHVSNILNRRHTVLGKYQGNKKMKVCLLDDNNRNYYHDGTEANLKGDRDSTKQDEGDVYVYEPHYWYKGVNDYINDKKYQAFSSVAKTPEDAGSRSEKVNLSTLEKWDGQALSISNLQTGSNVEDNLKTYDIYNVYKVSVKDAKMMRWPGIASGSYCSAYADKDGKCLEVVKLTANNGYQNGDYLFAKVPKNAVWLYFTAPKDIDTNLYPDWCVRCFSEEIVAVEPDWVEHVPCLTGAYEANYQNDVLRSISGSNATNNYQAGQYQDFGIARGDGFQCVDYEMSKDVANLFYAKYGTRDSQKQCGYGTGTTGYVCGKTDILGMRDTVNPNNASSHGFYYDTKTKAYVDVTSVNVMGYENWQGDSGEWMSRVGIGNGTYVTDNLGKNRQTKYGVWQITTYDGSVREVQGVRESDKYIIRVRNGRFCDVIATFLGGTSSTFYSDYQWYSDAASRVVARSYNYAVAYGGVACAHAYNAASYAHTYYGSRLAFRGEIEFVECVEEYKALGMVA